MEWIYAAENLIEPAGQGGRIEELTRSICLLVDHVSLRFASLEKFRQPCRNASNVVAADRILKIRKPAVYPLLSDCKNPVASWRYVSICSGAYSLIQVQFHRNTDNLQEKTRSLYRQRFLAEQAEDLFWFSPPIDCFHAT